jgi:hypothetical protein
MTLFFTLKIHYNEEVSSEAFDKKNFPYIDNADRIYTMSYLSGSFKDGKLIGTWNPPSPNPKNALLLWQGTMTFFYEQIKKHDPDFLNAKVEMLTLIETLHGCYVLAQGAHH